MSWGTLKHLSVIVGTQALNEPSEGTAEAAVRNPNIISAITLLCYCSSFVQWISLRELLTRCGRRLSVFELWALCHTCLSSLQTYTHFPGDFLHCYCLSRSRFTHNKNSSPCFKCSFKETECDLFKRVKHTFVLFAFHFSLSL